MILRNTIPSITVGEEVMKGRTEQKTREIHDKASQKLENTVLLGNRKRAGRVGTRADYKILCKPNRSLI